MITCRALNKLKKYNLKFEKIIFLSNPFPQIFKQFKQFSKMLKYPSTNPVPEFNRSVDIAGLTKGVSKYKNPTGKNLFTRTYGMQDTFVPLRKSKFILYDKRMLSPPAQECYGMDDYGNIFYGLNFASADYLGLCTCQEAKDAAAEIAQEFSVNSCGSPLAFGQSKYYAQLKEELKEFWGMEEVLLYSAGWLAGYGVIKGLIRQAYNKIIFIRQHDYVIMDELSHNCLQEGAFGATSKVTRTPHLDFQAVENRVREIRTKDSDAAILVITEGLFSMDSDYLDIIALQKMTKQYEAFLMIDCAHDFGCMGKTGKGTFEVQGLKDFSNVILMSGGSKCLSTNLGWVAINDKLVIDYLKFHSSAYMFTNAINPIQCCTALAQLRLLKGEIGNRLRVKILENYHYIKQQLNNRGFEIIGNPSPICPVLLRNEMISRIVCRLMMDEGIHCNTIEFPVVKLGQARLRVNLQPQHTKQHLDTFVETLDYCYKKAQVLLKEGWEEFQKIQDMEERKQKEEENQIVQMNPLGAIAKSKL